MIPPKMISDKLRGFNDELAFEYAVMDNRRPNRLSSSEMNEMV
jgi:hypothetical protein